ncbi:hypothetical protein M0R45_001628 [Rubus argutus]|uniref:Uncharacterized protein n=1 Tax=Rubus argutus TaxID=59490 RepID=A0AAW1VGC4_RUBAR
MILQTTLSAPALFSSCSAHRLHPLLFSKRRRFSYWHFNRLRPRLFTVAASENGKGYTVGGRLKGILGQT